MNQATIVFSSHRPETLRLASQAMRSHDTIVLEEPPTPQFHRMLEEEITIKDYLLEREFEFPEFSYKMCRLVRDLKKEGKTLYQVEPYLDILGGIHEFFAKGGTFRDFDPHSMQFQVYMAEKRATKELLNYYQIVLQGSFEATLEAVKQFARADAARIVLRDKMRDKALKPLPTRIAISSRSDSASAPFFCNFSRGRSNTGMSEIFFVTAPPPFLEGTLMSVF